MSPPGFESSVSLPIVSVLLVVLAAPVVAGGPASVDLVAVRNLAYDRAIAGLADPCQMCMTGPLIDLDRHGAESQPPAPLPLGQYYFEVILEPRGCPPGFPFMVLTPASAVWGDPVLLWRDHAIIKPLLLPSLEDFTGRASPIRIEMYCMKGRLLSYDLVILPLGTLGTGVTASIDLGPVADEDWFPPQVT